MKRLVAILLAVSLGAVLTSHQATSAPARLRVTSPPVEAVESIAMTVRDMDRAVDFYAKVLSFEKVSDVEVTGKQYERLYGIFGLRLCVVRMRLGQEYLDLMEFIAPQGRSIPEDTRSNDRWFQHIAIIVNDMDKAYQHLRQHKVRHASIAPQRLPDWNPNAGGIEAFYFRDPDGHYLEILHFPSGKGDPRWQRQTDKLFLGIDHSAIVVQDTDASLRFYRDKLGLKIVGSSENYGPEQERLNNVFGARLRITTLKAKEGPAIELLEYLAPRNGHPFPTDSRTNDIWHWHVRLSCAQLRADTAYDRLISPGNVVLPQTLGFTQGVSFRDPDGHALFLTNR